MPTIHMHVDPQFAKTRKVLVAEDGAIAEHEQVWLWDLYCARMLHALGTEPASASLQERLTEWAVNAAGKAFSSQAELQAAGVTTIDPALVLSDKIEATAGGLIEIAIEPQPQAWSRIDVTIPAALPADHRAASVVALAQHFLRANPLFVRELPIHILALKKFYADTLPATDPASVEQAPAFALNKALQLYQDLSQGRRPRH